MRQDKNGIWHVSVFCSVLLCFMILPFSCALQAGNCASRCLQRLSRPSRLLHLHHSRALRAAPHGRTSYARNRSVSVSRSKGLETTIRPGGFPAYIENEPRDGWSTASVVITSTVPDSGFHNRMDTPTRQIGPRVLLPDTTVLGSRREACQSGVRYQLFLFVSVWRHRSQLRRYRSQKWQAA